MIRQTQTFLLKIRISDFRLSSVTDVEEINIYDGKDSVLKFQRIYTKVRNDLKRKDIIHAYIEMNFPLSPKENAKLK